MAISVKLWRRRYRRCAIGCRRRPFKRRWSGTGSLMRERRSSNRQGGVMKLSP